MCQYFGQLPDPGAERARRHQLLDIIVIAVCGVICGADSWVDIAEFGKAKQEWFESFLDLPNGIPSHDTFGRVFARLEPAPFEHCFRAWSQGLKEATSGRRIALDGKTLRRSHHRASGQNALHLISAWATEQRLVLGQQKVADHSNEIIALPALLELLTLEGAVVTIDAMGTQKEIARQVRDQGADYVLALKANPGSLYQEVQDCFALAEPASFAGDYQDYHTTVNGGHGRVEKRQYWSIWDPDHLTYLDEAGEWSGLKSIAMVEAERQVGSEVSRECRYYLSSLPGDAKELGRAIPGHWGIENGLHWMLDVAFREDQSRVRTGYAPENLALLRRIALNLLRQETTSKVGVKAKRLKAGWNEDYLLRVLTS
ncbi:MAG: ISAs1 family transposase [Dehalococcoidia bacterium]